MIHHKTWNPTNEGGPAKKKTKKKKKKKKKKRTFLVHAMKIRAFSYQRMLGFLFSSARQGVTYRPHLTAAWHTH